MESLALALEQAIENKKKLARERELERQSAPKVFDPGLLPPVLNPIVGRSTPKPNQNIFEHIDYAKELNEHVKRTLSKQTP